MKQEAIEKIQGEMQKDAENAYMEIVGGYIVQRCASEDVAGKILVDGKSLSGAWEEILAAAQKSAKNKLAVMNSEIVFNAVDEYFGLTRDEWARESIGRTVCGVADDVATPQTLDLTDFL